MTRGKPFQKGRKKTGGRKKGTPNKFLRREELETFLGLCQDGTDGVDLTALTKKFLSGKEPNERVFIRILEYCFGKPIMIVAGDEALPPVRIDISAIPRKRERA